ALHRVHRLRAVRRGAGSLDLDRRRHHLRLDRLHRASRGGGGRGAPPGGLDPTRRTNTIPRTHRSSRRGGLVWDDSAAERPRDLAGYGAKPPDPKWPDGARLALNFVLNYEEGSEPSIPDGDKSSEIGLTEGGSGDFGGRDLAAESMFEYGSRVGI